MYARRCSNLAAQDSFAKIVKVFKCFFSPPTMRVASYCKMEFLVLSGSQVTVRLSFDSADRVRFWGSEKKH